MGSPPRVSVLLAVRDGMPFLPAAVDSILGQSFEDLELVLVDDGSADSGVAYIAALPDPRVVRLRTDGVGLVGALNLGLGACRGEFIARMDADDISRADRIAAQVAFLDAHAEVGVVCSDIVRIDDEGRSLGGEQFQIASSAALKQALLLRRRYKPVVHPSVMIRTALLRDIGGYRDYAAAEDIDLWLRLVDRTEFARIDAPLLTYRLSARGISRRQRRRQTVSALLAVLNYEVCSARGVDLFVEHPALLQDMARAFEQFAAHVGGGAACFEELKAGLRGRRPGAALRAAWRGAVHFPDRLFPRQRRRLARREIDRRVALSCALLDALAALPAQTARWAGGA